MTAGQNLPRQDSFNPRLVQRLMRPVQQPGVHQLAMAQRIIQRTERFLNRLPLLVQQTDRWGQRSLFNPDSMPIVYAQPVPVSQGVELIGSALHGSDNGGSPRPTATARSVSSLTSVPNPQAPLMGDVSLPAPQVPQGAQEAIAPHQSVALPQVVGRSTVETSNTTAMPIQLKVDPQAVARSQRSPASPDVSLPGVQGSESNPAASHWMERSPSLQLGKMEDGASVTGANIREVALKNVPTQGAIASIPSPTTDPSVAAALAAIPDLPIVRSEHRLRTTASQSPISPQTISEREVLVQPPLDDSSEQGQGAIAELGSEVGSPTIARITATTIPLSPSHTPLQARDPIPDPLADSDEVAIADATPLSMVDSTIFPSLELHSNPDVPLVRPEQPLGATASQLPLVSSPISPQAVSKRDVLAQSQIYRSSEQSARLQPQAVAPLPEIHSQSDNTAPTSSVDSVAESTVAIQHNVVPKSVHHSPMSALPLTSETPQDNSSQVKRQTTHLTPAEAFSEGAKEGQGQNAIADMGSSVSSSPMPRVTARSAPSSLSIAHLPSRSDAPLHSPQSSREPAASTQSTGLPQVIGQPNVSAGQTNSMPIQRKVDPLAVARSQRSPASSDISSPGQQGTLKDVTAKGAIASSPSLTTDPVVAAALEAIPDLPIVRPEHRLRSPQTQFDRQENPVVPPTLEPVSQHPGALSSLSNRVSSASITQGPVEKKTHHQEIPTATKAAKLTANNNRATVLSSPSNSELLTPGVFANASRPQKRQISLAKASGARSESKEKRGQTAIPLVQAHRLRDSQYAFAKERISARSPQTLARVQARRSPVARQGSSEPSTAASALPVVSRTSVPIASKLDSPMVLATQSRGSPPDAPNVRGKASGPQRGQRGQRERLAQSRGLGNSQSSSTALPKAIASPIPQTAHPSSPSDRQKQDSTPTLNIDEITNRVERQIMRRLVIESERRGRKTWS